MGVDVQPSVTAPATGSRPGRDSVAPPLGESARPGRHADPARRRFIGAGCALTVAFLLWQVVWAVLTPAFRAPDEPLHFNSVLRVAQGQGWPAPGQARVDSQVLEAVRESGLILPSSPDFSVMERTRSLGSQSHSHAPFFFETDLVPAGQRLVIHAGQPTEIVDQMTQHPPLFYVLEALAHRAVGAEQWPWDRQLLLLRLVSVLMTLPVVPAAMYTTWRIGGSRGWALGAGALAFAVPQLAFVTGSLNNDALAIGAGALCIAACASAMFGGASRATVVAAGLSLGLGLWSKGTFIPMGLTVGLAFLASTAELSRRQRVVRALSAGGIGVLVGGPWWLRNLALYGVLQPAGYESVQLRPGTDARYFLETASRNLVESFWGRFDWMDWSLPGLLIAGLAACALGLGGAAVAHGGSRQRLVLASYAVLVSAMLVVQAWSQYRAGGIIPGTQGRYLFPGIVGLLALWGLGAQIVTRACGPGRGGGVSAWAERSVPFLFSGGVAAVAGASAFLWARACYPGGAMGIDLHRWALASGLPQWLPLALVVAVAAFSFLALRLARGRVLDQA